jgi:hypothetical protein
LRDASVWWPGQQAPRTAAEAGDDSTNKPAVGSVKLAPNVTPGNLGKYQVKRGGGRLIANDGAGIVAGGAGNFRAR